jgi:hypothetical protein
VRVWAARGQVFVTLVVTVLLVSGVSLRTLETCLHLIPSANYSMCHIYSNTTVPGEVP